MKGEKSTIKIDSAYIDEKYVVAASNIDENPEEYIHVYHEQKPGYLSQHDVKRTEALLENLELENLVDNQLNP